MKGLAPRVSYQQTLSVSRGDEAAHHVAKGFMVGVVKRALLPTPFQHFTLPRELQGRHDALIWPAQACVERLVARFG